MPFKQVLGHDRQKDVLERAVKSGRLAHAYLFEGPEGVGKRLMALALVRMLFCEQGNGCGGCVVCRKIDHGNHPDIHQVEADGTMIKIEQIRALQREVSFKPLEAPRKVVLIEGADLLNQAAGNALLKTLEEPRGDSLFLLLSSRPEAVLSTIRSRCQRLRFSSVSQKELHRTLRDRLNLEDTQAHLLAALSDGSFKKAFGKDQEFYLQTRKDILKAVSALSAGSIIPLFKLAEELAKDKEHLPETIEILLAFYRDQLLLLHGRPEEELVNIDLLDKIHKMAERETINSLLQKLEAVNQAHIHLGRNVNKQLTMEVLLMRLSAPKAA